MPSFLVGDVEIAFDDEGEGRPLLFVHGHPFNRTMWRPQVESFSGRGFRTVAPDLRGYGQSQVAAAKTPLDVFASDLIALMDHLDIERVIVIGLSMGGQIVMELYRLFPDRVDGLVLADTSPRAETEKGKRERLEMAGRLEREGMGPYAEEVLAKMVAPHNIEFQPQVARHVLEMMRGTLPAGGAAALRGRAERPDYTDTLRSVDVPTLVVVGADDEFTPIDEARLIHELIDGSDLLMVEGAAHMPNLEQVETFNEALSTFLGQDFGSLAARS
jgi:pimeloyl-ACP methyl ester carboxylesterase